MKRHHNVATTHPARKSTRTPGVVEPANVQASALTLTHILGHATIRRRATAPPTTSAAMRAKTCTLAPAKSRRVGWSATQNPYHHREAAAVTSSMRAI